MKNFNLDTISAPIDRASLKVALPGYKNFNDKVHRLIEDGDIIHLRRGLYVPRISMKLGKVNHYEVANHLYGPSYVSRFTAMSFHGLIPERVYTFESVVLKRSKYFDTELARFDYQKVGKATFSIGIQHMIQDEIAFIIASPTKSVIDTLYTEAQVLNVHGVSAMRTYLVENLRIEEEELLKLDLEMIEACLEIGRRKTTMRLLHRLIVQLRKEYDIRMD